MKRATDFARIGSIANVTSPCPFAEPPRRVALFRALQLGDLLCAVPALRALRTAWPHTEFMLVGLPWAKGFVERFRQYLDGFQEFPGYPGLPEVTPRIDRWPEFLVRMQDERYDLVLQMHGSGLLTNPLTALFGARVCAGFYTPGQFCPDERYFMPYPEGETEVWRMLRLVEFLGVPLQGDHLEFPLTEQDRQSLATLDETRHLQPGAYVCVHPGARARTRRWPPERFARVADVLAMRGLTVVLTGLAEERDLTRATAQAMRAPCLDLAGRTSLGAVAWLLHQARMLIANDTGVSHLAAALQVPSVVLFTGSDPHRWAPSDPWRHRVLYNPDGIGPEDVVAQADMLMGTEA